MRLRPRRPAGRRSVRWFAWSLGLACLGFAASRAGAATDKIVVSEFLLRCVDGRADGAFVELVALGPGQAFDAALGVRLLSPSGATLTDLPHVFANRAGQPWPEGQHFLIATALFEPLTGVAPDTVFDVAPTSGSGSIVLYRQTTGTTIQVQSRIDYKPGAPLARTPPAGRSAAIVIPGLYAWSPDPSPTRSDGVLAHAPDCFADVHRPIRVTELATECGSGSPTGGFVEISPTTDNQALDSDLALRVLDHAGTTLFDVPLNYGSLAGTPWPPNRPWLLGDALLVSVRGDPPDQVLPGPLDAAGGRLVLHGLDASGAEVVLADLEYGTDAIPAPPPGTSLVWDSFTTRYIQRSPSTPTDFSGRTHLAQGCALPSGVRIRELMTSCATTAGQSYIDLVATGGGDAFDSTLTVVVRDAVDSLIAVVPAGFGSRSGTAWTITTNWLLGTAALTNDNLARADVLLPFSLDPVAGRIDLQRRVGGFVETIQSLRYGGVFPTPPPGQALRRVSDTVYSFASPPQPVNVAGQTLRCPAASDTAIVIPVTGMELCTGCWDGSARAQYVKFTLVPAARLDPSFVLRLYDRNGHLLGTRTQLFASAGVAFAPGARSWLVADYAAQVGAVDAVLPAPLDSLAGSVQVVSVRDGIERAAVTFHYGPGSGSDLVVAPGYCFRTFPTPNLGYPAPVSFNGVASAIPGCHFAATLRATDPHISEVFVACSDGSRNEQYIELSGIDPDRTPDPRLSLRVHDASGAVQQSLAHVLPASIPPELHGTGARTELIGAPPFVGATGLAPDRTLAQALPLGASTLELYFDDSVLGEQPNVQVLSLSPGTQPFLGRSLAPLPSGGSASSRHPIALRLDGNSFEIPAPCRDTSVAIPMVLQKLALGCFDGDPRGQVIQLVPSGSEDTLTGAFGLRAFDHTGSLVGEVNPAFGNIRGLAGSAPRSLLIARSDAPSPVALDAPLTFALDSLGGTLALVDHLPTGDRTSWSVAYPGSAPNGFIMGSVRDLDGTNWVQASAQLTNWFGSTAAFAGCHYGTGSLPGVEVHSVLAACGDGTESASYVEIAATRLNRVLAGVELEVADQGTHMLVPLFPGARAFDQWPAGRSLLLATDAFQAAMGFAPDRRLPGGFGTGTGHVSVRLADPTQPGAIQLTSAQLDFASFPEPGRALVRSQGSFLATATPQPATFDGTTHTLPPGCFVQVGSPDDVRLSGVMFACANNSLDAQFVQVERTSALAGRPPDLRLRLLNQAGALLGERDHLFRPGDTFWGPENSLVIGGPGFLTAFRFVPDATLPAAMDPTGGTIQLVRAEAGVDRIVSELRYGAGGVPVPPRAHALVLDHGTWRPDSLPHPQGWDGDGQILTSCLLPCESQRVQLSLSTPQTVSPAIANYSDTYSDVSYSLARAEFDVHSRFSHAELLMADRYALTGTASPETLESFVDVVEAHGDTCIRNACFHGSRRLHLLVNGIEVDSLLAGVSGHARLHARLAFEPGQTNLIQILATADGLLNPHLEGRVAGRLGFEATPEGTRVTSCNGYDSNLARVVRDATYTLSPHTIAIDWRVSAAPGFRADVQRLDESEPEPVWRLRETRSADASGVVHFGDPKVEAEHTYRYRLAWSDEFGDYVSDEVRIHTPRLPSFGLFGALPNPSRGALRVAFELPDPADVHVELFDLLGRRVREVRTSLLAGAQTVALDQGSHLPPGLYQVRLEAGGRSARTTVVVLP